MLAEEASRRDAQRARREHRGGHNNGWRCFNCKRFLSGRFALCKTCGYEHGGVNHDAEPTR